MNNRKIDTIADSTKAELSKHRRDLESKGYIELCATKKCENEAASGSCYCDSCEERWEEVPSGFTTSLADWEVQEIGEDGPYTRLVYMLTCTMPNGTRFATVKTWKSQDEAEKVLDDLDHHRRHNPKWTPVNNPKWHQWLTVYGSDAYGKEDEHAAQKLDVENEYGPGSYMPNHPGYLK